MSCDANCINIGIKTSIQIIEAIIQGSISPPSSAAMVIQLLTNAIQTFQCSLPPDIENKNNPVNKPDCNTVGDDR